MRSFKEAVIIGIILLSCRPCTAEGPGADSGGKEELFLSLNEALTLAVVNNFDVQLNAYDRMINNTDIDKAKSIYDTALTLTGDYVYDKSKKPTIILGQSSHTGSAGATLAKKLVTGTDIAIDFDNARSSTDSAFTSINPYYESSLEMRFTQPLLKNFFGMNDWANVRITKIDVNNFNSEILDRIEGNLADVEKAYWDAALAAKLLEIGKEMFDAAGEFYRINEKKRSLGTAEPADLIGAEANMETRRSDLFIEEDALKTAINRLKLLINHPDSDSYILPTDDIESITHEADFMESLKTAFSKRRDYMRAKEDIKARKIRFNMTRNERWPQLDFEGSLRLNGLGPVYKDATAKAFTGDNPVYEAKVVFSLPFEDGLGRSQYDKAKYEKAKALVNIKKVEKTVVTEIDDSARSVNISRNNAEHRIKVADLQRRKLEEEMKQYGFGRSSSDTIIRFQEDLLHARIQALNAVRNYKDAVIDLYLAEDTYLERRGLTVK